MVRKKPVDHSLDDTVKLERVLFDKERAKFWTLVATFVLSVFGVTQSSLLMGDGSKNKEDVTVLVRQLNDVVLPQIQKELDMLRLENLELRERLGRVDAYWNIVVGAKQGGLRDLNLGTTAKAGKEIRLEQEANAVKLAPPVFKSKPLSKIDLSGFMLAPVEQKELGY